MDKRDRLSVHIRKLSSVKDLRDRRIGRQDHGLIIPGHGSFQGIQTSDKGIEILLGFIGVSIG